MREKIKMVSKGLTKAGKPTGTFTTTTKNKRLTTEKLKKKQFDKRAYNAATDRNGIHVMFEEGKI
jgi:large subunit ribosomal protein L33